MLIVSSGKKESDFSFPHHPGWLAHRQRPGFEHITGKQSASVERINDMTNPKETFQEDY